MKGKQVVSGAAAFSELGLSVCCCTLLSHPKLWFLGGWLPRLFLVNVLSLPYGLVPSLPFLPRHGDDRQLAFQSLLLTRLVGGIIPELPFPVDDHLSIPAQFFLLHLPHRHHILPQPTSQSQPPPPPLLLLTATRMTT